MTEAEKNEIVGLVMTEISSQAVDFDIATEEPKANDLLTAVRENESGGYKGVTIKWNDVARIATELANQAATRAEQAETDANNILEQVQSKGTEITNFVATSKTELETQKNESVNAVKSVYQTDLDELKGDLVKLDDEYNQQHAITKPILEVGELSVSNKEVVYSDSNLYIRTPLDKRFIVPYGTVFRLREPDKYFYYVAYTANTSDWYSFSYVNTERIVSNELLVAVCIRRKDWGEMSEADFDAIEIIYPQTMWDEVNQVIKSTFSLKNYLKYNLHFWDSYSGLGTRTELTKATDFIKVNSGETIHYDLDSGNNSKYSLLVYNENKMFIAEESLLGKNSGSMTFANDRYVRFCDLINHDGYVYFDYVFSDNAQNQINALSTSLTALNGRDYMISAVDRIANQLKSKSELGNIAVFGFSTDQHIYTDVQIGAVSRGLQSLSMLTKEYPFDFICLGGDSCHSGGYDNSLSVLLDYCARVQKPLTDACCPVIPIAGNHEAYQNNENMTGEMLFNIYFKRIAKTNFLKGWDNSHTNGYWDSAEHNIRFIFFDDNPRDGNEKFTTMNQFLENMLSGTPEGYKIVVFSHQPLSSKLTTAPWANPLSLETILNQYADKIICCICGHIHADNSETSDGILYIGTTMGAYGNDINGNARTLDTEQETAFDTFVIDQTNRKIYAFRYGYGSDREWTY